jgi:hypothetical protein
MKSLIRTGVLGLLAAVITITPLQLVAQSTNKPATDSKASAPKAEAKKARSIPFEGDLAAVDKAAKTIKVGKRTFEITSDTKLFIKGDKPATLDQAVVGEYVTGSYRKTSDEKLVARNVYFGGKNKAKTSEKTTASATTSTAAEKKSEK